MNGKRVSQVLFVALTVLGGLLEAGVFGEEARTSGRTLIALAAGQNIPRPFGKDE